MNPPLWLASASPRRRALLEAAGRPVEVRPADIDETRRPSDDPVAHALRLAREKAATGPDDRVIIAADTVVHQGERHFDKPTHREEAATHLRTLSGAWHEVTTAVAVRRGAQVRAFPTTTAVRFRTLSEDEIARYLATGEADDKAGAYGIQGLGGALVAEVRGSYTNVIGLPLEETLAAITELEAFEAGSRP